MVYWANLTADFMCSRFIISFKFGLMLNWGSFLLWCFFFASNICEPNTKSSMSVLYTYTCNTGFKIQAVLHTQICQILQFLFFEYRSICEATNAHRTFDSDLLKINGLDRILTFRLQLPQHLCKNIKTSSIWSARSESVLSLKTSNSEYSSTRKRKSQVILVLPSQLQSEITSSEIAP